MKILIQLGFVCVFISCTNPTIEEKVTVEILKDSIHASAIEIQLEYLDKDSVKINGKLSLISETSSLYGLLRKPDSIVSPNLDEICVSYFDKDFKYGYFDKSQFEIYGDTSVAVSIDFAGKRKFELKTPKLILKNGTTLAELGKYFPNAVRDKYEINISGIGKAIAVRIPLAEKPSDDSWLFLFLNSRLFRIDYYMPC